MAEGNKPTSKANVKTNAKAKVGLTYEEKHLLYDESDGLNAKDKKHALALMTEKEQDQYKLALKKQAALKTTAGVMKKTSHEQHLSDAKSDGAKHEELGSDGALCTVHMAAEDADGCSNSASLQEWDSDAASNSTMTAEYEEQSDLAAALQRSQDQVAHLQFMLQFMVNENTSGMKVNQATQTNISKMVPQQPNHEPPPHLLPQNKFMAKPKPAIGKTVRRWKRKPWLRPWHQGDGCKTPICRITYVLCVDGTKMPICVQHGQTHQEDCWACRETRELTDDNGFNTAIDNDVGNASEL